ncbi:hypothetical protein [Hymenobacter lapidiphilus]|uniref:Uncharacterized protein n=1 Tax=Hymenobacter lapidiphilus TaxID=2608003 RepID=A0A7Y7PPM3_9BACT|nr:hypothetical protein [Hymenobacter lapidiphilus]NVO31668.1 hypothetical protein [Hymenobacter lapidiphilus]
MMLFFPANQPYPQRPLPPAPYLTEEPREATTALEAAVRACPKTRLTGDHARPTPAHCQELAEALESGYLTHREAVWLEIWQYEFDANTMAAVLPPVQRMLRHRQLSGGAPRPQNGGWFWPEAAAPAPAANPTPTPVVAPPARRGRPRKTRPSHD